LRGSDGGRSQRRGTGKMKQRAAGEVDGHVNFLDEGFLVRDLTRGKFFGD